MQLSEARRRQLILFTIVIYGTTIYSVYDATMTSISFLQTVVKLTEGFNLIIISVFALLNSALVWRLSTLILFGNLRLIEYEHVLERLPFTLINTILMISMFKEQDFFTVALFGFLLIYMKVFHWILRDRLDGLLQNIQENTTVSSLIFTRFTLNMAILFLLDYHVALYCLKRSLANNFGASTAVLLMIGMEFVVLVVDLLNLFLHSCLNFCEFYQSQSSNSVVDRDAGDDGEGENEDEDEDGQFTGMEGKFMYERIIDIFTKFLKTIIHCLMLIPAKMPVMLMKDIVWDCITLYQSVVTVWRTWRNNKQLDDRLPTVTDAELKQLEIDNICIICMDELIPEQNTRRVASSKYKAKRLPCGHVLHLCCLKNWMERSQTCPICRLPVFDENGEVLPSRGVRPNPASDSDPNVNTDMHTNPLLATATESPAVVTPTQTLPFTSAPQAEETQHRQMVGSTWHSFPIETSDDNSLSFTLKDSKSDRQVPVKLVIEKNGHDIDELNDDNENDGVQRIIIPNEYLIQSQTIDTLKRRVSELENQVQDLNKRLRKD